MMLLRISEIFYFNGEWQNRQTDKKKTNKKIHENEFKTKGSNIHILERNSKFSSHINLTHSVMY